MARTDLPPEVQRRFFDFHWDRERLWKQEAPVEEIPVEPLLWLLDLPVWQRSPEQKVFDLSPGEVMRELERFPDHAGRIRAADLRCPILLMKNLHDEWAILDGYHRFAKAVLGRLPSLPGKRLGREVIPLILRSG